jgi:hypothetical protein
MKRGDTGICLKNGNESFLPPFSAMVAEGKHDIYPSPSLKVICALELKPHIACPL